MGSKLQIQDLFNIAFGTSVGKLHVPISRDIKLTNKIGGLIVYILFLRSITAS